jgi:hypothetical protein
MPEPVEGTCSMRIVDNRSSLTLVGGCRLVGTEMHIVNKTLLKRTRSNELFEIIEFCLAQEVVNLVDPGRSAANAPKT